MLFVWSGLSGCTAHLFFGVMGLGLDRNSCIGFDGGLGLCGFGLGGGGFGLNWMVGDSVWIGVETFGHMILVTDLASSII